MIFAVIFGTLSDKELLDRRVVLCVAVLFWSVVTSLAGLAQNLVALVLIRSLVGVGEAAYGTIAPPMLTDFFPANERNVVFGVYYLAIPVGGALGYGIGAVLGAAYGWRIAFIAIGFPGLVVAMSILRLTDPKRGINDINERQSSMNLLDDHKHTAGDDMDNSSQHSTLLLGTIKTEMKVNYCEVKEILCNRHYTFALAGITANNFALGGLAEWFSTFLLRYDGASLATAGLVAGAATVVGGLLGTVLGAKVSDYYKFRVKSSYFLVPACFTIPGAICLLFSINLTGANNFVASSVLLIIGEVFLWTSIAPVSALSISVIPPRLRARSCGIQIFTQHILGDIISPPIIGAISDSTGSLQSGLQICWIFIIVSGMFWFAGYYFLPPLVYSEEESAAPDSDAITYRQLLCCGNEPLVLIDGEVVRRDGDVNTKASLKTALALREDEDSSMSMTQDSENPAPAVAAYCNPDDITYSNTKKNGNKIENFLFPNKGTL